MLLRRGKMLIDGKHYYIEIENVSKALAEIGFVPFRVEHLAMVDKFKLVGCSPAFEPLVEGSAIPEYQLAIEMGDDGEYERASVFLCSLGDPD